MARNLNLPQHVTSTPSKQFESNQENFSQESSQKKQRARGANWTPNEQAKLTSFCCDNVEILDAELSGGGRKYGNITADQQQSLWKQITATINGMGIQKRTVAQIKRKWHAIKSKGTID